MARVVLALQAHRDLKDLITTHSLPDDTPRRLRPLWILRDFPAIGRELGGRWQGYRFPLGPWRWMVVVYRFDQENDAAIVLRIYDGRSGTSPTSQ